MFIDKRYTPTLQSRRDAMFIDKRYTPTLQSRRDDMFIENVEYPIFSPVGTICL